MQVLGLGQWRSGFARHRHLRSFCLVVCSVSVQNVHMHGVQLCTHDPCLHRLEDDPKAKNCLRGMRLATNSCASAILLSRAVQRWWLW